MRNASCACLSPGRSTRRRRARFAIMVDVANAVILVGACALRFAP
jgi:hypothetical protein